MYLSVQTLLPSEHELDKPTLPTTATSLSTNKKPNYTACMRHTSHDQTHCST